MRPSDLWRHKGSLLVGIVVGVVLSVVVANLDVPGFATSTGLEKGDLVILSGKDESRTGERMALINQWNALHPDSPATIEELSGEADKQRTEMVSRAQSAPGKVDVFNLDVTWTAEFADAGFLRPMSGVDTTGFLAKPLASCRYDGELWALPFNSDAGLLFYRKDLVPNAPSSLSGIQSASREVLGAKRDPRLVAGFAGQLAADHEGLTVNAMEAMWAMDGAVVDEEGVLTEDWDQAEEAVEWLAKGLRVTPDEPQVVLPESRTFTETGTQQAFREGKVAFMRTWPVVHRSLSDAVESPGAPKVDFEVAELPGESALGGQNLAVSAHSAKPRAARALVEFLTSPRSQQLLFERGGFAATREIVYKDGVLTAKYPYARLLLQAIQQAKLRPVTPHYYRFSAAFRQGINEALDNGGQLPSDLRKRLQDALRGK